MWTFGDAVRAVETLAAVRDAAVATETGAVAVDLLVE